MTGPSERFESLALLQEDEAVKRFLTGLSNLEHLHLSGLESVEAAAVMPVLPAHSLTA